MTARAKKKKADPRKASAATKRSERGTSRLFGAPAEIMGPRLLFIICTVGLCIFGLVMIYSASSITAYSSADYGNDPAYFFKKQIVWLVLGAIVCVVCALLPHRFWTAPAVAWGFWGVTALLLLAVALGLGTTQLGADRSLTVAGFAIQPSEFAKISVLLLFASIIERYRKGELDGLRAGIIGGVATVITIVLIFKQPDLGTAIILFVGILVLMALGGVSLKIIGVLIGAIVLYVVGVCIVQPYHIDRIVTMFNPWLDPQGSGYQSVQGLLAFGSGGIFGTGLGFSRQKYLYLPYAYNDFIYAVVGEELGLVGALLVLLTFALFIYAGLRISRSAPDTFGCMVAGSLTCMIGFQACVNMACVVGIAPVTGKALPFISYGGSSLLASLIMVGIVISVSRASRIGVASEKRRDDLVVMDGASGRGRVGQGAASRGGRTASTKNGRSLTVFPGKASGQGRSAGGSARGSSGGTTAAGSVRSGRAGSPSGAGRTGRAGSTGRTVSAGRTGSMPRGSSSRGVGNGRADGAGRAGGSTRAGSREGANRGSGSRGSGSRAGSFSTSGRTSSNPRVGGSSQGKTTSSGKKSVSYTNPKRKG